MALFNKRKKIQYASIVAGRIAVPCTPQTPGSEKYTNKENVEKFYLFSDDIEGYLEFISWKNPPEAHPEFSASWLLQIQNEGEVAQLQLNFSSGYAQGFFCQLPNINPELPVTLAPSLQEKIWEGKMREQRNIFVRQEDEPLKWAFTKNDPGRMPPVEKTTLKSGKDVYDDTDRNEFFKELAQKYNEQRKIANKNVPEEQVIHDEDPEELEEKVAQEGNDDSLPF